MLIADHFLFPDGEVGTEDICLRGLSAAVKREMMREFRRGVVKPKTTGNDAIKTQVLPAEDRQVASSLDGLSLSIPCCSRIGIVQAIEDEVSVVVEGYCFLNSKYPSPSVSANTAIRDWLVSEFVLVLSSE